MTDDSSSVINHLTTLALANQARINSLHRHYESHASASRQEDTDDDDSVSTDNTDDSIQAAVNALRQHSMHSSSGRNSDFRYGPR